MDHKCRPEDAGTFFKKFAGEKSPRKTNSSDEIHPITLEEKILLLKLAYNWFTNILKTAETATQKQGEIIQQLENTILFLSTEQELATTGNLEGKNTNMVLEVIISRLLETGNLVKAERICMKSDVVCNST